MTTPSLAMLMRARKAGITAEDMTLEELAQAEAAMLVRAREEQARRMATTAERWRNENEILALRAQSGSPPQVGRRGDAPAGQTVSPAVFGQRPTGDEGLVSLEHGGQAVLTSDPSAVMRVGPTMPAPAPQPPDVLEGLILKGTESDPASSTFLPFPKVIAEKFGLLGVDYANLSVGEKVLLRRMGVKLPTPKRRRS